MACTKDKSKLNLMRISKDIPILVKSKQFPLRDRRWERVMERQVHWEEKKKWSLEVYVSSVLTDPFSAASRFTLSL